MELENEKISDAATENAEDSAERLTRKCDEVKNACCGFIDRMARDLKECNYNPYIKQTRTYKLEVFRSANETDEPIDVYETTDEKAFSARSLLIAGAATAVMVLVTGGIVKKLLDN